ncbi:hypothetical protein FOH38_23530 [Lysinibacillus fusiformis]|nr:hypothetical protein FOH38_23530 [Lysinibacillus fusiformis]
MDVCARCNRKLRSQKSIGEGMGPVCKRKAKKEADDEEFRKIQITIFDVELTDGGVLDAGSMRTCTG